MSSPPSWNLFPEEPLEPLLVESVHLLDEDNNLKISSEEQFAKSLDINPDDKVKVVTIFGSTGDGKSHTLNHTFFDGAEIFQTSPYPKPNSTGVWAKYHHRLKVICVDTEGFLEMENEEVLFKIFAITDVIIYRAKSERLQRPLYRFLGKASKAYKNKFEPVLEEAFDGDEKPLQFCGPALVIFHECDTNKTLDEIVGFDQTVEEIIKRNFEDHQECCDSFSCLKYVGVKSAETEGFETLRKVVEDMLESNTVRLAREVRSVYQMFKSCIPRVYLSTFFTCPEICLSCQKRCSLSMGHVQKGSGHFNENDCQISQQYQNHQDICRNCHKNGITSFVTTESPSWTTYEIKCPECGPIHQGNKFWYGNPYPNDKATIPQTVHVWRGDEFNFYQRALLNFPHPAQKLVDQFTFMRDTITGVTSGPAIAVSEWVRRSVAPCYWKPLHEIQTCRNCDLPLLSNANKIHCRACGEGFCTLCTSKTQPVPWRGWPGNVRVCDRCYGKDPNGISSSDTTLQSMVESLGDWTSTALSLLNKSKELIKDNSRPDYWKADSECEKCCCCEREFGSLLALHHCRDCGQGVCDECSPRRRPVPYRGWREPVRICKGCDL